MIDLVIVMWIYFSIGTIIGVLTLKYIPLKKNRHNEIDTEDLIGRLAMCIAAWPISMFFFIGIYASNKWGN